MGNVIMDYAAKMLMYAGAGVFIIPLFAGMGILIFRFAHETYKAWDGIDWDQKADLIMLTAIFAGIYLFIAGLLIFAASQTVFASA
jgi:hypothetical protein